MRGAYVQGINNGANEQRGRQNSLQACTLAHACACAIDACIRLVDFFIVLHDGIY